MARSPRSPLPTDRTAPRNKRGQGVRSNGHPVKRQVAVAGTDLSAAPRRQKSFGFRKTNAALLRSTAEKREQLEAAKRMSPPASLGSSRSPASLHKKHVFMVHRHPSRIEHDDGLQRKVRISYHFKKFVESCRRQKRAAQDLRQARIESDLLIRPTLLLNLVPIITRVLEACFEKCWVCFTFSLHPGAAGTSSAAIEYRVTAVELMGLVNHRNSVCIPMEVSADYAILRSIRSAANVVARQLATLVDSSTPRHERDKALRTLTADFPVVEDWGERVHELLLYAVAVSLGPFYASRA
jgi:hypothetical protein